MDGTLLRLLLHSFIVVVVHVVTLLLHVGGVGFSDHFCQFVPLLAVAVIHTSLYGKIRHFLRTLLCTLYQPLFVFSDLSVRQEKKQSWLLCLSHRVFESVTFCFGSMLGSTTTLATVVPHGQRGMVDNLELPSGNGERLGHRRPWRRGRTTTPTTGTCSYTSLSWFPLTGSPHVPECCEK